VIISIIIRVVRSGNNNKRMVVIRVIVEVNDTRESYDAEDATAARTARAGEPSHLVLENLLWGLRSPPGGWRGTT
jgi:hypothetical protein